MKKVMLWLSGLVAFFGALWIGWAFRARNSLEVDLDLIWFRLPAVEIWWGLMLAFGSGALVATLIVGFVWLRAKLMNRQYRSMSRRLEKELHQLRSLPLIGSDSPASEFDPFEAPLEPTLESPLQSKGEIPSVPSVPSVAVERG